MEHAVTVQPFVRFAGVFVLLMRPLRFVLFCFYVNRIYLYSISTVTLLHVYYMLLLLWLLNFPYRLSAACVCVLCVLHECLVVLVLVLDFLSLFPLISLFPFAFRFTSTSSSI